MARVREYSYAPEGQGVFRQHSFYFPKTRKGVSHKLVLRFDKRTVTLSRRESPNDWVVIKTWRLAK